MGVCSPLQWRNRSGFSPDSLTFDRDKDELAFTVFKERCPSRTIPPACQVISREKILAQSYWLAGRALGAGLTAVSQSLLSSSASSAAPSAPAGSAGFAATSPGRPLERFSRVPRHDR